jgi:hypothetical protein
MRKMLSTLLVPPLQRITPSAAHDNRFNPGCAPMPTRDNRQDGRMDLKNLRGGLVFIAIFALLCVSGQYVAALGNRDAASGPNESLAGGNSDENFAGDRTEQQASNYRNEKPCGEDAKEGEGSAVLFARAPGISVPSRSTLLSAVAIVNRGKAPAEQVEVRSISLAGGKLTSALPVSLGRIADNESAFVGADFSGGPFVPGKVYVLVLAGTYSAGEGNKRRCEFTFRVNLRVPPRAPGSARLKTIEARPRKVEGAPYPEFRPKPDIDVNRSEWTVPTGPFVAGKPTPTSTGAEKAPIGDPPAIDFVSNDSLGVSGASGVAEPSGSTNAGGIIFTSANWLAAYSVNGGNAFTQLKPTTIFPNDAVGYCCDQIVQYAPSIDRFIWLLQGNGVRLAVATPADVKNSGGTAWTYWDLTPDLFGATGFDYPDLSIGDNYLYMSWNAYAAISGHMVARTSLAGLQSGGTITIEFTNPADGPMAWFAHLVQNTGNEIFWAGHNNTSNMRVFSLAENSNTYFWRDIGIASWTNSGFVSNTPDNQNWLGEVKAAGTWIAGGTRAGNDVWFAWTAGQDNNFRQAHVNLVALNRSNNFNVDQQVQIWNNDYAFGYPALSTNACTGEVGLSLEYGGNGHYEDHVVGFWGDFLVYITTASNTGSSRFGDYVTLRQAPPTNANPGNLFNAYGYGITGGKTDIHYVLFGRPASACNVAITNICKLHPEICHGLCTVPGCFIVNPIEKYCAAANCPGCPGGLCPFYHLILEELGDPWTVEIRDPRGNPVKVQQVRTSKGVVVSFRPSPEFAGKIGEYKVVFKSAKAGLEFDIKPRLEFSEKPLQEHER